MRPPSCRSSTEASKERGLRCKLILGLTQTQTEDLPRPGSRDANPGPDPVPTGRRSGGTAGWTRTAQRTMVTAGGVGRTAQSSPSRLFFQREPHRAEPRSVCPRSTPGRELCRGLPGPRLTRRWRDGVRVASRDRERVGFTNPNKSRNKRKFRYPRQSRVRDESETGGQALRGDLGLKKPPPAQFHSYPTSLFTMSGQEPRVPTATVLFPWVVILASSGRRTLDPNGGSRGRGTSRTHFQSLLCRACPGIGPGSTDPERREGPTSFWDKTLVSSAGSSGEEHHKNASEDGRDVRVLLNRVLEGVGGLLWT